MLRTALLILRSKFFFFFFLTLIRIPFLTACMHKVPTLRHERNMCRAGCPVPISEMETSLLTYLPNTSSLHLKRPDPSRLP